MHKASPRHTQQQVQSWRLTGCIQHDTHQHTHTHTHTRTQRAHSKRLAGSWCHEVPCPGLPPGSPCLMPPGCSAAMPVPSSCTHILHSAARPRLIWPACAEKLCAGGPCILLGICSRDACLHRTCQLPPNTWADKHSLPGVWGLQCRVQAPAPGLAEQACRQQPTQSCWSRCRPTAARALMQHIRGWCPRLPLVWLCRLASSSFVLVEGDEMDRGRVRRMAKDMGIAALSPVSAHCTLH